MVWQECKVATTPRLTVKVLSLTSCLVLSNVAEAQPGNSKSDSTTPAAVTQQAPPNRQFLDGVLMTVDNRVILFSEVQDEFEAVRSGKVEAASGKKLTLRQERQIYQEIMVRFQQKAVRASAALTLPNSTPEQIRDYVERVLQDEKRDLIDQYGSLNKMKEEMSVLGNSTFMIDRKQRETILMALSEQELRLRLKDRAALMITPKMLRDHYRKVKSSRHTKSVSDLGRLTFAIKDPRKPAAALKQAREAIAAWRQGEQTAAEIAEKFGGLPLTDMEGLTLAKSKEQETFIADFIGKAKTGDVSEPTVHGRAVFVLKILSKRTGSPYRWDNPAVQEQLRTELLALELHKLRLRAAKRDWGKVFRWESPLAKRL